MFLPTGHTPGERPKCLTTHPEFVLNELIGWPCRKQNEKSFTEAMNKYKIQKKIIWRRV